jgi:hypothetical protein
MNAHSKLLILALATAVPTGARAAAAAESRPAPRRESRVIEHPRQEQVLRRDDRERRAVKELLSEKKITDAQAKELLAQLRTVDREDRADAKANGGYITRQQQANMDQLLTAIRHETKGDEKSDKLSSWLSAHPRQAEVLRRDWIQQDRVRTLVAQGKLTREQGEAVIAELHAVAAEDRADAKADDGHITKAEQAVMNKQEGEIAKQTGKDVVVDHASLEKWLSDHPRQAQVLRRDWREQDRVDRLFAEGKIDAAQRDAILAELHAAAAEDHADAKADGGRITQEQQAVLDRQEKEIAGQMHGDVKVDAAWLKAHPRQAEVLRRDRREQDRVEALAKAGKITEAQAKDLVAQLRDVTREDFADAEADGGRITKAEQSVMNRQENEIRKEIKSDK